MKFVLRYLLLLFAALLAPTLSAAAQAHFTDCTAGTGNNATLLVPAAIRPNIDGRPLQRGDEIAVFASDGRCAGAVAWSGGNTALTLWGDDPYLEGKDGLAPDESFTLHVWEASTGREYAGTAVRSANANDRAYYRPLSTYAEDALYVLSMLAVTSPTEAAGNATAKTVRSSQAEEPLTFSLEQNYPNPFNPGTTISDSRSTPMEVQLEVVSLQRQRVEMLAAAYQPAGDHEVTFDARDLPSGVYLYRLTAGNYTEVRRMLLAK